MPLKTIDNINIQMKKENLVHLVYNPGAGPDDEDLTEEIAAVIRTHGFNCVHPSVEKKLLKDIDPQTEFIAVAGGDGTVKKVMLKMLNKKLKHKRPLAILPHGTANNVANSLGIPENMFDNVSSWSDRKLKRFDVGQADLMGETRYFVEGLGFGLFPKLIKVLSERSLPEIDTPEDEFEMALEELSALTQKYKAVPLKLWINNDVIEEDCILLEVMNISSLGPRLALSPKADPSDGLLDVIIVTEKQRPLLLKYFERVKLNPRAVFPIKPIRVNTLALEWQGKFMHIDDELVKVEEGACIEISVLEGVFEVLMPTSRRE
ncbi:MAG: diacylglycerol kinase [Pedobacter sp.]|nr:MAG: diacylglycerol kinase [Pedobacter sp.]